MTIDELIEALHRLRSGFTVTSTEIDEDNSEYHQITIVLRRPRTEPSLLHPTSISAEPLLSKYHQLHTRGATTLHHSVSYAASAGMCIKTR